MTVALYMGQHVPGPIVAQLRRRGIDVLTAFEDGHDAASDDEILRRAGTLGRVIFTQDIRFRSLAEQWQRQGTQFAGLAFGHQLGGTIGQFVRDLELIARATDPSDWLNRVEYLPY
ncbi:MAG: DUF5615 family PIN-like protein [Gemmataceae bacterium]|nr:DUF5615 family PIN-like protein [Gemmataceae bacterium]